MLEFKVYVGTYQKYNEGSLFGEWIDLTQFNDSIEFWEYCAELHNDEPDPEFMIQDWENTPGFGFLISECYVSDQIWDLLDLDLSDDDLIKLMCVLDQYPDDLHQALEHYQNIHIAFRSIWMIDRSEVYDIWAEMYPEAHQAIEYMDYIDLDWHGFVEMELNLLRVDDENIYYHKYEF